MPLEESGWAYSGVIQGWVDGDTVKVQLDLGFHTYRVERMRLLASAGGVDTYEMKDRDPAKRDLARRGLARALELAPLGASVWIRSEKAPPTDGFGRYLARVTTADGVDIGDTLLAEGLAVAWKRST